MNARALVAWNVRRIRVERGIPQDQLAYDAGIDRSYMGRIEQKKENPTIDLLERIAATLGIHLSELFTPPAKGAMPPSRCPEGASRQGLAETRRNR
ncbi:MULTISPECIES: helix-turn-helix domain-containing protein [Bradyrhizobium]|uniref:Transcriptional regulator with XRE-family HTH domain n=2 Tax=Bradyrhizobium TaxID=374 RepID=A0ABV4FUX8_9BRAD|nr:MULTISPECIES: helix-turn-helix transcriptional regulator [Bradyrhizobium]APG15012.1 transcriptional regulator [Bradyrhizobium japonicum]MBR1292425.1 helix-turn-helix transcriptional regulator [Bradyrhizobium ottawaense]MCD9112416.1 helix-turn-helix transcriptional regulator [Bradyrhizobium japonicum]MCD9258571.1 helix-turn-helix transcriptional regulator [Bradyrhizobium japonicum SEMIA 5079]MCD9912645.1 helix-turn-helix transcriptional regulator [Bradyrhizobium japonicum]